MTHDVETVPREDTPAPERRESRPSRAPRHRAREGKGRWLVVFAVVVTLLAVGALRLPS